MPEATAFVLSKGVDIDLTDTTLSITHSGDITIEDTLGRDIGVIRCGGDLVVRLPRITGTLIAKGKLLLDGEVSAKSVHGGHVQILGKKVVAKGISATESVQIGPAVLQCDAIVAPHVILDPSTSGRVTVIECHNETPATKLKGGFSLADYEDMFGGAETFLSDRGIQPLAPEGAAPIIPPLPSAVEPEKVAPAPVPIEKEVVVLSSTRPVDDEDVDDPLSLSLDDLEPLVQSPEDDEAVTYRRLTDALERIVGCYEGSDIPPAVMELESLIKSRDLAALKENITEVWNGLLGFHQKRGIRPHHQVTHAFNVIHSLVS